MNILANFEQINTLVFDVDGVMTDGSLILSSDGEYLRTFNIKDGFALQLAIKKGINIWVITGSQSNLVKNRLAYLGITEFHQKVTDKKALLLQLMQQYNVSSTQTLFMGDDMPDVAAMQHCAIAACPADAAIDVLQIANYISPMNGGQGCVRDVIEKTLKLKGLWQIGDTASV